MKKDEELLWTPVKKEHIVTDKWIDFREVRYRYPDGREFGPFYQYSRKSYSVIVPITEDGHFVCVRQFRQGLEKVTTEFPAGGIEALGTEYSGDPKEDPLTCAKRELMEESGYESDDWTHLLTVPSNATLADNYAYIYLAKNCRRTARQHLDETEDLEYELLTGTQIEDLIHHCRFQQAVHVLAYLLAAKRIKETRTNA